MFSGFHHHDVIMDKDAFLPSEIARLILGYLKKIGCNRTYQAFLTECPHLKEYVSLLKQGTVYPTIIHGRDLEQMLQEYGCIILGLSNQQSAESLCRKFDNLLQRLASLEAAKNKHEDGNLQTNTSSAVVATADVTKVHKANSVASCLPDFDQISLPTEQTEEYKPSHSSKSGQQHRRSRSCQAKLKEPPPTQPTVTTAPVKSVKKDAKAELALASPRRKRQPPKRRSTSSDFPLIGRSRVSPLPASTLESSMANSNDSFMSQASQGFVPCIEELCHNSKFAEKLAESINKVSMIKLGHKSSSEEEVLQQCDRKAPAADSAEKKEEDSHVTTELLDQLLMEEDTINNIIDMTTNDPDFDVLFNMFRVDKNEFIEKEYGVKLSQQLTSSDTLTFSSVLQSDSDLKSGFHIRQPNQTGIIENSTKPISKPALPSAGNMTKSADPDHSLVSAMVGPTSEKSISSYNMATTVVSDLTGNVIHVVPLQADTAGTDDNASLTKDTAAGSLASNAVISNKMDKASNLIELVFPAQDGQGSTVEVVEVITIASDHGSAKTISTGVTEMAQSEAAMITDVSTESSQTQVEPEVMECVSNTGSNQDSADHTRDKVGVDPLKDSSQKLTDAINQLNVLLSQLSQVILLQQESQKKEDTSSSTPVSASTQQSQTEAVDVKQLQEVNKDGTTSRTIPSMMNIQAKALEQLAKLVQLPISVTSSSLKAESKSEDAHKKRQQNSFSEPKNKRRRQAKQVDDGKNCLDYANTSDSSKKHDTSETVSRDVNMSTDNHQETRSMHKRRKKGGKGELQPKRKSTFVEPWKVDHSQDKRKFLGVIWKNGSLPAEKKVVSEQSASLLLESGDSNEVPVGSDLTLQQSVVAQRQEKTNISNSSLPELSAKDVVDVANSPGVTPSVDANCLSLTSLDNQAPVVETEAGQSNLVEQKSPASYKSPPKSGHDVCTSNFGRKNSSNEAVVDHQKGVHMYENQSGNAASPAPSMPSSFDFVFQKKADSKSRVKSSSHEDICEHSERKENDQSLQSEQKQETEIAQTLISLAALPVVTSKEQMTKQPVAIEHVHKSRMVTTREEMHDSSPHKLPVPQQICDHDNKGQYSGGVYPLDIQPNHESSSLEGNQTASQLTGNIVINQDRSPKELKPSDQTSDLFIKDGAVDLCGKSDAASVANASLVAISDASVSKSKELPVSMRVASKPTSLEKKNLDQSDTAEDSNDPSMKKIEKEDQVDKKKDEKEDQGKCNDSLPNAVGKTPIKCIKGLCSPKRTHVLTKLVEQGMKMTSPKKIKTCKRIGNDGLSSERLKVTKMKENSKPLITKINLSELDMEKILSKIHR